MFIVILPEQLIVLVFSKKIKQNQKSPVKLKAMIGFHQIKLLNLYIDPYARENSLLLRILEVKYAELQRKAPCLHLIIFVVDGLLCGVAWIGGIPFRYLVDKKVKDNKAQHPILD